MKLQSVSNPTGESAEQIPRPAEVTEKRTANSSEKAVPSSKFARKRIVTGKSDEPLAPRGPGVRFETILGADERTRIVDTEDAPWRMICALAIDGPWGSFIGTGWLAGPRTIVTAGHCVYDTKQMGGWANKIVISPGRDGNELPFGSVESISFSTTNVWKTKEDPDFDVAAIHLSQPLGDELGWFQVASLTDDRLRNYMVNVSGYPGDRGNGTEQWWAKNRIHEATPRRIFYEVDTFGGQSGGPAYIYEADDKPPVVVGIHAYGIGAALPGTSLNSAPRIIPEVVTQIQAWIDQDNARR